MWKEPTLYTRATLYASELSLRTAEPPSPNRISCDVAVVGGGIAALWCARLALARGLSVVLLTDSVGGKQTLAAQGIIHSGYKYRGNSATAMRTMPARWLALLSGVEEIDLSDVDVIAPAMTVIDTASGEATRLEEPVVDVHSLMGSLWRPLTSMTISARVRPTDIDVSDRGIDVIRTPTATVSAKRYLIGAGAGNDAIAAALDTSIQTTTRPLRQLVARSQSPVDPIFCHVFSGGDDPVLTVTTHSIDGATYFYFGGGVATENLDEENFLESAREEIARLLPTLPGDRLVWSTIRRDRSELQAADTRELDVMLRSAGNATFCWPTKLCLAPRLADKLTDFWPEGQPRPTVRLDSTATLEPSPLPFARERSP